MVQTKAEQMVALMVYCSDCKQVVSMADLMAVNSAVLKADMMVTRKAGMSAEQKELNLADLWVDA